MLVSRPSNFGCCTNPVSPAVFLVCSFCGCCPPLPPSRRPPARPPAKPFFPQSDFFAVCIELAPPPTAELKAASKKLAKGGGAAKSSSTKKKDAAAREVGGTATGKVAAVEGGNLGERVIHGDFDGEGEGRKGRWRACLAESGKVGLFGCCRACRILDCDILLEGGVKLRGFVERRLGFGPRERQAQASCS